MSAIFISTGISEEIISSALDYFFGLLGDPAIWVQEMSLLDP
jgi:hypothetical protein